MQTLKHSVVAKFTAGLVAAVMAVSAMAPAVNAQSNTSIEDLLAQITALQAQLAALNGGNANSNVDVSVSSNSNTNIGVPCSYRFNRNLYLNSRGEDVMMMQKFMNANPATAVSVVGAGSKGNETTFFGNKSRQAVVKYQLANGITPAAGYFYPKTRASVNAMIASACSGTNPTNPTNPTDPTPNPSADDELMVDGGNQPRDMVVAAGQRLIPTTVVEMEAGSDDVTVRTVMVEVTGNARRDVDEVSVMVDGMVVDTDSVDSDNMAELELNLTIDDGEEVEVTFTATVDELNDDNELTRNGLQFMLEVVEIETDGADVDGLPIDGAEHTTNEDLKLNTFDYEVDTEDGEVQVGDTDEMIVSVTVENNDTNNNDESIFVKTLAMEHVGSADLSDLRNLMIEDMDEDDYEVSVMGDVIVVTFDDAIEIEENEDMDFDFVADIRSGTNDEIVFALESDDLEDFVFIYDEDDRIINVDELTADDEDGEGLDIERASGNASDTDDVRDDEISVGEEDARFASFDLDVEGEMIVDGEITITMFVDTDEDSDRNDIELDDVRIIDENGDEVASEDDVTITTLTGTFTQPNPSSEYDGPNDPDFRIEIEMEDVEFEVGDMTYYIVADVSDDVTGGTEYYTFSVEFDDFEGEESDDNVDIDTIYPDVTQTVEGALIAVGVDSSVEDDTLSIENDVDEFEVASIIIDASDSGEDVMIESLEFTFTVGNAVTANANGDDVVSGTATGDLDDIQNCALYMGDERVTDEEDLSGTTSTEREFDFDDFTVEADEVEELSMRCDIEDNFAVGDLIQVSYDEDNNDEADADADNADDVVINQLGDEDTFGPAVEFVDGDLMSDNGDEPVFESVVAGTQKAFIGSFELDGDDVRGELEEFTLVLGDGSVANGGEVRALLSSGKNVFVTEGSDTVYSASDRIATVSFAGTQRFRRVDNFSQDVVFNGGTKTFGLFVDVATGLQPGQEGDDIVVNLAGDNSLNNTNNVETSVIIDNETYTVDATTLEGVSVYSTYPEFVEGTTTAREGGTQEIARFAITAEGDRDVDLLIDIADLLSQTTAEASGANGSTGALSIRTGNSYTAARNGNVQTTNANFRIDGGDTKYFVVFGDDVEYGDGDRPRITTSLDFEGTIGVDSNNDTTREALIVPIEGDTDVILDEELSITTRLDS